MSSDAAQIESVAASPRGRFAVNAATLGAWLVALQWAWLSCQAYLFGSLRWEDVHAYWVSAHGEHLYGRAAGTADAFLYSPLFAQIVHVPAVVLPWSVFATLWSLMEAAAFAWLLWPLGLRWAIPAWLMCLPAVLIGNVFGLLAVAAVLGVRGGSRAGGWWAFGLLTKVTPEVVGIAYLLGARRLRAARWALVVAGLLIAVSWLTWPSAWSDWITFLGNEPISPAVQIRTAAALLVAVSAGLWRRPWLLAPALLIASPNLGGFPAVTVLAALPRLFAATTLHSTGSSRRWR